MLRVQGFGGPKLLTAHTLNPPKTLQPLPMNRGASSTCRGFEAGLGAFLNPEVFKAPRRIWLWVTTQTQDVEFRA